MTKSEILEFVEKKYETNQKNFDDDDFALRKEYIEAIKNIDIYLNLEKVGQVYSELKKYGEDSAYYIMVFTCLLKIFKISFMKMSIEDIVSYIKGIYLSSLNVSEYEENIKIILDESVKENIHTLNSLKSKKFLNTDVIIADMIDDIDINIDFSDNVDNINEHLTNEIGYRKYKNQNVCLLNNANSLSEVYGMLKQQIVILHDLFPEQFDKNINFEIKKISLLENLSVEEQILYVNHVKSIDNADYELFQKIDLIFNVTNQFYNRIRKDKIIEYDFSKKK